MARSDGVRRWDYPAPGGEEVAHLSLLRVDP